MLALYVLISPCALSPRGRCPRSAPAVRLSGDKLNHTAYEGRNTQVDAGGRKLSNQKKVAHIYSRKQRGKWNPAGQESSVLMFQELPLLDINYNICNSMFSFLKGTYSSNLALASYYNSFSKLIKK